MDDYEEESREDIYHIKMTGLYGFPDNGAWYRKDGDCFDFCWGEKYASDLTEDEAKKVLADKDYYLQQFNASDMVLYKWLDRMPFDHVFEVDGNEELCHATGKAIYSPEDGLGDEYPWTSWWNEYRDNEGNIHYGR